MQAGFELEPLAVLPEAGKQHARALSVAVPVIDMPHKDLDAAVAAAYGWPADFSDDAILERLFKLNQERAEKQAQKGSVQKGSDP